MTTPKHVVSAATIVINNKNEILLIQGPRRGWEMPGGQVEEGEALEAAAIRETKEESGIDIEIIKLCDTFQNLESSICNTLFLAKPIVGVPTTSPESLKVGFFPMEEALEMVTWDPNIQSFYFFINEENDMQRSFMKKLKAEVRGKHLQLAVKRQDFTQVRKLESVPYDVMP